MIAVAVVYVDSPQPYNFNSKLQQFFAEVLFQEVYWLVLLQAQVNISSTFSHKKYFVPIFKISSTIALEKLDVVS